MRNPAVGLLMGCSLMVVLGAVGACSGGGSTTKHAALSEGCLLNTDCNAPLVCAFRRCHTECEQSRDCPEGQRCMASDRPFHVCQLDQEKACTYNSQCPEGQLCGVDGQCRDQCSTDRDCVTGQVCTGGTCAEPKELTSGGTLPVTTDAGTTGTPCVYSSDCPEPLVCKVGQCVPECVTAVDCPRGYTCSSGSCVVETAECVYNSDCTAPQICLSGKCSPQCVADRDCPVGSVCVSGACSLPEAGAVECYYTSDCAAGMVCRNNRCISECSTSRDCSTGFQCLGGRCVLPGLPDSGAPGYGTPCNLNSDCLGYDMVCGPLHVCVFECLSTADCTTSGTCCLSNHCVVDIGNGCVSEPPDSGTTTPDAGTCVTDIDCDDGKFCTGAKVCRNGACELVGTADACDDNNPCTLDQCDEATHTCSHATTAPVDEDKDGHYAIACGGTADDCDDKNGAVYPGHLEQCDGVDNNCNGQVDEGLWNFGNTVTISQGSTGTFGKNMNPSAIARLGDGTFDVVASNTATLVSCSSSTDFARVDAWHVDAALAPLGTATLSNQGPGYGNVSIWPRAATNGTLLVGTWMFGSNCGSGATHNRYVVSKGDLTSPLDMPLADTSYGYFSGADTASPPAVGYNGQNFVLAWADTHATGDYATALVYLATLSTAGVVTNTHTITGTLTDVQTDTSGDQSKVYMSVGPTTAMVAYRRKGFNQVRYWILDSTLTSAFAGPLDLTGTDEARSMGAAHVGTSFALATQSNDSKTIRVHRIDDRTGAVLATSVITNPSGGGDTVTGADGDMAAVGSGFAITMSRGVDLGYAWAREDFAGGFTMTEINTATASSARIAPIDAKHVAVTWADNAVKAAILTCSP